MNVWQPVCQCILLVFGPLTSWPLTSLECESQSHFRPSEFSLSLHRFVFACLSLPLCAGYPSLQSAFPLVCRLMTFTWVLRNQRNLKKSWVDILVFYRSLSVISVPPASFNSIVFWFEVQKNIQMANTPSSSRYKTVRLMKRYFLSSVRPGLHGISLCCSQLYCFSIVFSHLAFNNTICPDIASPFSSEMFFFQTDVHYE